MKSDKEISYKSRYKNEVWDCRIKNIKTTNEITSFILTGKHTNYFIYLIRLENCSWLAIPEMNISSPLASLNDTFWNSERIGNALNSIVDGIMIADGLNKISENAG